MIESSIVTYEGHIIDWQKGTPASVEFDFMRVWDFKKSMGLEFFPQVLSFFHVHPKSFSTQMSSIDVNCIKGFVYAFKFPIDFSIIVFSESHYEIATYTYFEDLDKIHEFESKAPISKVALNLLRNLSNEK